MDAIQHRPRYIPYHAAHEKTMNQQELRHLARAESSNTHFDYLCLYNPHQHGHIASKVMRCDFQELHQESNALIESPPPGEIANISGKSLKSASLVLQAAGIDTQALTQEQTVLLADLLGSGVIDVDWANKVVADTEKEMITSKMLDHLLIERSTFFRNAQNYLEEQGVNTEPLIAPEIIQLAHLLGNSLVSDMWAKEQVHNIQSGSLNHATLFERLTASELAPKDDVPNLEEIETLHPSDSSASVFQRASQAAGIQALVQIHSFVNYWFAFVSTEIAIHIINDDGTLNEAEIDKFIARTHTENFDNSYPSNPDKQFLRKCLWMLKNNTDGIADRIQRIQAPLDQNSKAAGKIRTTLGLPPDAIITEAIARRAALSALFTPIRQQRDTGSCFATAIAIKAKNDDPIRFLSEIQSLIENDQISIQGRNRDIELPICTSLTVSPARTICTLVLEPTEQPPTSYLSSYNETPITYGGESMMISLTDITQVTSALSALGIPEERHNAVINQALVSHLGEAYNPGETNITENISFEILFKAIIKDQNIEKPQEALSRALEAFQAKESNVLLQSWEYTLASLAEASMAKLIISRFGVCLREAISPISSSSFTKQVEACLIKALGGIAFNQGVILKKQNVLVSRFRKALHQNLHAEFHPHLQGQRTSANGWTLHHYNDAGEKIFIRSERGMQQYLFEVFKDTCLNYKAELQRGQFRDPEIGDAFPADKLVELFQALITTPQFIPNVIEAYNKKNDPDLIHTEGDWFFETGGHAIDILSNYYGVPIPESWEFSFKTDPQGTFLLGLAEDVREIQKTTQKTHENIVCDTNEHTFNIRPQEDLLFSGLILAEDPEQYLEEHLFSPGKALANQNLDEEMVKTLTRDLVNAIANHESEEVQEQLTENIISQIEEKRHSLGSPLTPLALRDLFKESMQEILQGEPLAQLTFLDMYLVRALNPPMIAFADENFLNSTGQHTYLTALYNPLNNHVEIWRAGYTGGTLILDHPIDKYMDKPWTIPFNAAFYG